MHKPHKNQPLIQLKTSYPSFHLSVDLSHIVSTNQVQSWVITEDTQCSSRISSLKNAKASKIFHYIDSPLYNCPNLLSCSSSQAALPNTQAITS